MSNLLKQSRDKEVMILTPQNWYEKMAKLYHMVNTPKAGVTALARQEFANQVQVKNVEINHSGIYIRNKRFFDWLAISDITPQYRMTFEIKSSNEGYSFVLKHYNSKDVRKFKEYKENEMISDINALQEIAKVFRAAGYNVQVQRGLTVQSRNKAGMLLS